jgi:hypothetical protein
MPCNAFCNGCCVGSGNAMRCSTAFFSPMMEGSRKRPLYSVKGKTKEKEDVLDETIQLLVI